VTKFNQFGGLVLTIAFGRLSCIFYWRPGDTLLNPGTGAIMQACVALRKPIPHMVPSSVLRFLVSSDQRQQQADNYLTNTSAMV
jgi:hypothetical protein